MLYLYKYIDGHYYNVGNNEKDAPGPGQEIPVPWYKNQSGDQYCKKTDDGN